MVASLETMNVFLLFVVLFFSGKLGLVFDAANDSKLVSIGVISAVLKAGSSLLFQRALQLSPVSLSVPYLAFTPALLLVTSYFMLGERPEPAGVAGVFVMTAGAYGLNAAGRKDRQGGGGGMQAASDRGGYMKKREGRSGSSTRLQRASEDPAVAVTSGKKTGNDSGNGTGLASRGNSAGDLTSLNVAVSVDRHSSDSDTGTDNATRFELFKKIRNEGKTQTRFPASIGEHKFLTSVLPAEPGSRLMLLVAIAWSFTSDLDKMGKSASPGEDLVVFIAVQRFCMWVPLSFAAIAKSGSVTKLAKKFSKHVPLLLGLAVLEMYTMAAYLKALDHLYVSYAIAAKRSGILLSVVAGALFFDENIANRLPFVLVILGGMFLVLVSGNDF